MENTQVLFARRPKGMPAEDNFEVVHAPLPEPADGDVLRRTDRKSVV